MRELIGQTVQVGKLTGQTHIVSLLSGGSEKTPVRQSSPILTFNLQDFLRSGTSDPLRSYPKVSLEKRQTIGTKSNSLESKTNRMLMNKTGQFQTFHTWNSTKIQFSSNGLNHHPNQTFSSCSLVAPHKRKVRY